MCHTSIIDGKLRAQRRENRSFLTNRCLVSLLPLKLFSKRNCHLLKGSNVMKKTISIILISAIFAVCMFGSSTAEEFSLHNGVQFGMTLDEVKAIESDKNEYVIESKGKCTYYDDDGDYVAKDCITLEVYGSMAGIAQSIMTYCFNDEGHLFAAYYEFGEHDFESYNQIQELIESKYPDRVEIHGYDYCPLVVDYLRQDMETYSNFDEIMASGQYDLFYQTYDCTYIPLDDNTRVYLCHLLCYPEVTGYSVFESLLFGGKHYLEYHIITMDELNAINNQIDNKNQKEAEEAEKQEREKEEQRKNDI